MMLPAARRRRRVSRHGLEEEVLLERVQGGIGDGLHRRLAGDIADQGDLTETLAPGDGLDDDATPGDGQRSGGHRVVAVAAVTLVEHG